jgi:hypothetical protein
MILKLSVLCCHALNFKTANKSKKSGESGNKKNDRQQLI